MIRRSRRERLGFRSSVHSVLTEESLYNGRVRPFKLVFDETGEIDNSEDASAPSSVQISGLGDRIERTILKGMGWSMKGLHGIAFGTHGAEFAETSRDPQGCPVETRFLNADGTEICWIIYRSDGHGNILTAIQHLGRTASAVVVSLESPDRFLAGNGEIWAQFRYGTDGCLLERQSFFGTTLLNKTVFTYNERGDEASTTWDNDAPVRMTYEYDDRSNWTRKSVHHALGVDEHRRTIVYYD